MSVRAALKLLVVGVLVFAVAFALRRAFFWNVVPLSWDQEPQSLWALGTAFLLRSMENLAAAVAVIALGVAAVLWLAGARTVQPRRLRRNE